MEPKLPIIKDVNLEAPDEDAPTLSEIQSHAEDVEDARRKGEL